MSKNIFNHNVQLIPLNIKNKFDINDWYKKVNKMLTHLAVMSVNVFVKKYKINKENYWNEISTFPLKQLFFCFDV